MKRIIYLLMTVVLVLSLAACGKKEESAQQNNESSNIGNMGGSNSGTSSDATSNPGVASDGNPDSSDSYTNSSDANPFMDSDDDTSSDWNPFADDTGSLSDFFETKENELEEAKKANPLWEGIYMDLYYHYDDKPGYVEIRVTDDNMLNVSYNRNGETGSFLMEQTEFEVSDERDLYGKEYKAVDGEAEQITDTFRANLYIDSEYFGEQYQINLYVRTHDNEELVCMSSYVKCIFDDNHDKPDGYADVDEYGRITEALADNSGYFTPLSDDYAIRSRDSESYTYDQNTWETLEKYPIVQYSLYDFDKNGAKIKTTVKEEYESAEAAAAMYDYYDKYVNMDYVLSGNCIYCEDEYDGDAATIAEFDYGYEWYYDCHYFYACDISTGAHDDRNHEYVYRSKPFTKHEYNEYPFMTEGNAKLFGLWESGYYACKDDDCSDRLWYNGFSTSEVTLDVFNSYDAIRMYDDYAYTLNYGSYNFMNDETGMYEYYDDAAVFTKVEYNEKEITVTDYIFNVENGDYTALEATFENFESLTPDRLEKHTYDMTKKAE